MLSENLKHFRKAKGLSQEELAIKLHIVRQTVSKWEKGLSVPDSGMLIRLAEALDTSVTELLGETAGSESSSDESAELKAIAAKLELLNEPFAARCERQRKLWRAVFVLLGAALLVLLYQLIEWFSYQAAMERIWADMTIIGGNDGPTNILCGSTLVQTGTWVLSVAAAIIAGIGIYKTRKK